MAKVGTISTLVYMLNWMILNYHFYQIIFLLPVHPCDTTNNGGCNQICNKRNHAYECACQEGFALGEDRKTCSEGKMSCVVTRTVGRVTVCSPSEYWRNVFLNLIIPYFQYTPAIKRTKVVALKFVTRKWKSTNALVNLGLY